MAHLLRLATAVLAVWAVLSVPLGLLLGRWLRRVSRANAAAAPGVATPPAAAEAGPRAAPGEPAAHPDDRGARGAVDARAGRVRRAG